MLAGDYHNGPLSVLIPFGVWGALAFVWFLVASFRALYLNYHHGDPDLKIINTFLIAYFAARLVFFTAVFGGFYGDLAVFSGIVGLSIALNHGIRKPVTVPAIAKAVEQAEPEPALPPAPAFGRLA